MRETRGAGWVAALVTVALVLPSRLSVPLAAALVTALLLDRWALRAATASAVATCSAPRLVHYGQPVEACVSVTLASRIPPARVELDVPSGMGLGRTAPYRESIALSAGGTATRRIPLMARERGRHSVGPPMLRLGSAFGFGDAVVRPTSQASITVLPRIVPLAALRLPADLPFADIVNPRALHFDRSRVVGVRPYTDGDPLSAVHWRASGRSQRLMVKEVERGESHDLVVCLDTSADGYDHGAVMAQTELAIVVAASVLYHTIAKQRLCAGLLACDTGEVVPSRRADGAHLLGLLEHLALVRAGGPVAAHELLATAGQGLDPGATVLLVTGRLHAEALLQLKRLRSTGVAPAVVLTGADDGTAQQLGIPMRRVAEVGAIPFAAS